MRQDGSWGAAAVGHYLVYQGGEASGDLSAVDPTTMQRFRIAGTTHSAWGNTPFTSGSKLVSPLTLPVDRGRVLTLRVIDLSG